MVHNKFSVFNTDNYAGMGICIRLYKSPSYAAIEIRASNKKWVYNHLLSYELWKKGSYKEILNQIDFCANKIIEKMIPEINEAKLKKVLKL